MERTGRPGSREKEIGFDGATVTLGEENDVFESTRGMLNGDGQTL